MFADSACKVTRRFVTRLFVAAVLVIATFGRAQADGLLMKTNSDTLFPHVATHVWVDVSEQVAVTVADFAFVNNLTSDSIVARFAFPVPEKAVVTDIGVYKGAEIWFYKLEVSDTSSGNQQVPGGDEKLQSYLGPNPFVVPVKIGAGLNRIRLKYIEILDFADDRYRYRYPLSDGPFATSRLDTFSIQWSLMSKYQIAEVRCTSHPALSAVVAGNEASLVYDGGGWWPVTDLTIEFGLQQTELEPSVFCYRTPSNPMDSDGYFAVIFRPPSEPFSRVIARNFVFIIDKSGSMMGDPMRFAKEAAKSCISKLGGQDYFNVIWFSSGSGSFRPEPVPATGRNKSDAYIFIDRLEAAGSTNLYTPVMEAVQQASRERLNQIILLTDGIHNTGPVLDRQEVIQRITSANVNKARIYCFGLGSRADLTFLAQLAEQNNGKAFYIPDAQSIQEKVSALYDDIDKPILQVEAVAFENLSTFEVYPRTIPDFALGRQVILSGRYDRGGTGRLVIQAKIEGRDTSFVYENIVFPDSTVDYPFARKLWAKEKIEDLYQQWLAQGQPEALRQQIIELSLVYGVLSPFTEFTEPQPPTGVADAELLAHLHADVHWETDELAVAIQWEPAYPGDGVMVEVWKERDGGSEEQIARVPVEAGMVTDADVVAGSRYRYRLVVIDPSGEILSVRQLEIEVPLVFPLSQPYPNPFNASTVFRITVPGRSRLVVQVCDLLGRLVRELFRGELSGSKTLRWDGTDETGRSAPSGLYLIRVVHQGKTEVRKVALLR